VDFDWFSASNPLLFADRARIVNALRGIDADATISQDVDGTLSVRCRDVQVSLFAYRYALLEPTAVVHGLPVASKTDIAAMKLAAILGRGGKKDFVDLYCLMRERPLEAWLDDAVAKFTGLRDFRALVLRALVYFSDADAEPMPDMRLPIDWDRVKAELLDKVLRISRRDYGLDVSDPSG